MEAERYSEMTVNFYQATQRHIPEGTIVHSHGCEDPYVPHILKISLKHVERNIRRQNLGIR
jgi:hypothetical protein